MSETLTVKRRDSRGTQRAKQLRRAGSVPAILYGHGQESVSLALAADQLAVAMRHGARLVTLTGDLSEKALLHQLQWDTYGTHVVHVDLTRVDEHELLHLRVSVELKGTARGVNDGGVVELMLHEVDIECRAADIPEKLIVNITDLALDGHIKIGELKPPAGVKVLGDAEEIVVHCVKPREETAAAESGPVEPEVIGRKPEDGEEAAE